MEQLLQKRAPYFRFLFPAVYFISYLSRYSYAAVLLSIITGMNTTKSVAGLAVTGAFISYGAGQLLSGYMGDRFQPQRLILIGLVGTGLCNLSMVFLPNIVLMNIVWIFNGLFQTFLWPPLVRLTDDTYKGKTYGRVITVITQSGIAGQIAVILLAALLVNYFSFRSLFLTVACITLAFALLWFLSTKDLSLPTLKSRAVTKENSATETEKRRTRLSMRVLISAGMLTVFLCAIIAGALRDGISTWMPTYIKENFEIRESLSILTSIALPLFGILGIGVSSRIIGLFKNELYAGFLFFGTALGLSAILTIFLSKLIFLDIILMGLISACSHGINLIITGVMPRRFSRFGQVSTISGILNATIYIGSALSTYGVALLAENFGWKVTFGSWMVMCVLSIVCLLVSLRSYVRFCREEESQTQKTPSDNAEEIKE